jgi:lipid-A-disaccharide synthase
MAREGQQRIVRAEDVAVMGISEIVRHIPKIYASYRRLVASIRRNRPDVAVLIDFPDVNFRLAKHLKRAGVPVIWFVSPQLWAWKRGRLRWVQERVAKMLVIFPFEERFYRERGVDAEFVGHPLLEAVEQARLHANPILETREGFADAHNLDPNKTWIALLPGSRWKEIRSNLPALHELAMSDLIHAAADNTFANGTRLELPVNPAAHTRFEFLLPVASTIDPRDLAAFLAELNREHLKYFGPEAAGIRLTLLTGPDAARQALEHARASVVASGTATVLAAIVGNPFVVVYRVSPLTFALAKKLVEYPEEMHLRRDLNGLLPVSMVNLIAGRRIVPELLQDRFNAANVASALAPLLVDSPERETQIAALAQVRASLAAPHADDAITRLADAVLAALA